VSTANEEDDNDVRVMPDYAYLFCVTRHSRYTQVIGTKTIGHLEKPLRICGEREARLSKQGWRMHIQRKGSKDKPISDAQQRRNHRIAKTRPRIEHVFAGLAQMGGKALRSIGLARATLRLNWKVAAYNLQRLVYLREAGVEAF
jgi:hypothetical protein